MSVAFRIAHVLCLTLLVGGVLGVTVLAHSEVASEWVAGDSEVPSDVEVEEEKKTLPERALPPAPQTDVAGYAADHAVATSAPSGAPPTPPPEA